ncbi:hypothetical protein PG984_006137 [Apiospora sp. TS-2023a]
MSLPTIELPYGFTHLKTQPRKSHKLRTSICSIDSQKLEPCHECEDSPTSREEIKSRITTLCKQLWRFAEEDTIDVQYFDEGSFNQLFIISCADFAGQLPDVVLRLPWIESSITRTVAILEYLNKHTDLKVPKVIHWDATEDNALSHDYVIMSRIPGKSLQSVLSDLSQEQRMAVAKEVAQVYRQMESVTSPIAGRMKAHGKFSAGDDPSDNVFIQPFGTEILEIPDDPINLNNKENGILPIERLQYDPPGLTINEIMMPIYQRRIYELYNRTKSHEYLLDLFEPLQEMVQGMVDNELFKPENEHICLQHPDFFPRNIMVDFTPDPVITGVIDWDEANFVPRFATCVPPRWLWQSRWWKQDDDNGDEAVDDENDENDEKEDGVDDNDENEECDDEHDWHNEPLDVEGNAPTTPEEAEIKRVFEEAIGERWVSEATSPWFPLARRLLQFSRRIMYGQQDDEDVADWKRRWDVLFPDDVDDSENSENLGAASDH